MTITQTEHPGAQAPTPLLRVVGGNPTAEELAVLTAVVLGLQGNGGHDAAKGTGADSRPEAGSVRSSRTWARREMLHLGPKPGPGAWRRSFR